jgi:uncharacterized protein YndB with AHSA1/START domain
VSARAPAAGRPALKVGDEAVRAKTGKVWADWFKLLDKEGARKLVHPEIATLLHEQHGLSGWWAQMVTVGYEQGVLGRAKGEKKDGYEVSVSKTVAAPMKDMFNAWTDAERRAKWLDAKVTIRKATPFKSMRVTWSDGKTILAIGFYDRPGGKSQVAVQHGKLKDAKQAERVKAYWAGALNRLKAALEAG